MAKDQNVRLRTGWFSDRSATYLMSGRPVITQDTGFGRALPTGEGLFAFSTADEVVEAVERIDRDPERHRRSAREIALEYFAADAVLGEMLDQMGMRVPGRSGEAPRDPLPFGMVLAPVSRRPTRLPPETVETVLATPSSPAPGQIAEAPEASIVVVSFDSLVYTRMCIETVLANTGDPAFELIVVDNGSSDGTREYLDALAERDSRVVLIANDENRGFPAACNQALAAAGGEFLVLLNSDTIVAPGWLSQLISHIPAGDATLVGPVTNRIGNEAEIATGYDTYGGFLREARSLATSRRGESFEIQTLTMFCLAMRREAYEAIGSLDESYGVGTLEDDDYSMRARRLGHKLLCAEDVLVHHFGEASFGKLFADGEYSRLIGRNRDRFADKWGEVWEAYRRRENPAYAELVQRIRYAVREALPAGSTVLMVSKGDERLLELEGLEAWHFPRTADGDWTGYHPADSAEVLTSLEELQGQGADYIAFPGPTLWWLDFYEELARQLEGRAVLRQEACAIFSLPANGTPK